MAQIVNARINSYFLEIFACVLILAKVVHSQQDCIFFGTMNSRSNDSQHIICDRQRDWIWDWDCEYLSVEVLKLQYCYVEWIESEYVRYRNVRTLDISFSDYTTLKYLHLNFEHLKRFNVSHNELMEVHDYLFNNTKQLTDVDFSHNQIETLHALTFSKVPKLTAINISHNQIEEINSQLFSELFELEILDLSDNKIRLLDISKDTFRKNSKLKSLNLKNNPTWRLNCDITQLLNGTTSLNVSSENVIELDLSCVNPIECAINGDEIIFKNARTKSELRYPKIDNKNLEQLNVRGNRLQNSLDVLNTLGELIWYLDLSENMLGKVNETAFHGLIRLEWLYLNKTNLSFDGSNPFEHLDQLWELDISYNNLKTLNVSLFAKTLTSLWRFRAAENHFDNGVEIIKNLGANLRELDLSQNVIGTLNRNTFENFEYLNYLNLSDTNLEHFDVNPLTVFHLDISRNQLKRLNVTLLSETLYILTHFYAGENDFQNTAEIIQHLQSTNHLDISENYVGNLNETTFEHLEYLSSLVLRSTNLSIFNVKPFETLRHKLIYLDISKNNLAELNFSTSFVFENFEEINFRGNHLTQLHGLTRHSYPKLTKLDITNNKLNCTHLSMFRKEWKELEIIGDPCDQFENNENQSQTDISMENTTGSNKIMTTVQSYDEAHTESTIAQGKSVQSSVSVVSYAVPIGVAVLIVNVVGVVVFLRRKSSSTNSEQMKVSYRRNENGEELPPEPVVESKPEDHIYEEIEERDRPYDHLRFEFNPMPIATENQHYHNFTLANRDRGTQS